MIDHYTYRVIWSDEDGEYAGLCAEFPSLSWLAATSDAALAGIRELVAAVGADMTANGETRPGRVAGLLTGAGGGIAKWETPGLASDAGFPMQ